jgi:hypothetical protein
MLYDVKPDGALANGRKFFDMSNETGEAVPDGMKIDRAGNIFATGPGGVLILSPQGQTPGHDRTSRDPGELRVGRCRRKDPLHHSTHGSISREINGRRQTAVNSFLRPFRLRHWNALTEVSGSSSPISRIVVVK